MRGWVALLATIPVVATAEMRAPASVPLDRLINNVSAAVKVNPTDPHQVFLLARLHALGYAHAKHVSVYFAERGNPNSGFSFVPWLGIRLEVERSESKLSPQSLKHLRTSYDNYREAIRLDPNSSLPKLGLGWVCEVAARYPLQTGSFGAEQALTSSDFIDQAIDLYRQVVSSYTPGDARKQRWDWPDEEPAYEAAKNLRRLDRPRTSFWAPAHFGEEVLLSKVIADYEARPVVMSPIIFPVEPTRVAGLLEAKVTTRFDIAADGIPRDWPWVGKQTAFLAWDPARMGKIKDATQLFGNRTFNMFFRDGYAALASLDNNRDGWLTGVELVGIVVWHDQNQNGVSDLGEVLPVDRWRITAIRARSNGKAGGMLAASVGIRFQTGRIAPTYDWLPTSKTGALER